MIESEPPVWEGTYGPVSDITPYGYLGEFNAGQKIQKQLKAVVSCFSVFMTFKLPNNIA